MKNWTILLPILFVAVGCQSVTPEERRAADEQTCRDYGFRRKNDAFAECLQRLELDRRAQRRANAVSAARFERDFWRPPIIIYRPAPPPRT